MVNQLTLAFIELTNPCLPCPSILSQRPIYPTGSQIPPPHITCVQVSFGLPNLNSTDVKCFSLQKNQFVTQLEANEKG